MEFDILYRLNVQAKIIFLKKLQSRMRLGIEAWNMPSPPGESRAGVPNFCSLEKALSPIKRVVSFRKNGDYPRLMGSLFLKR